MNLKLNSGIEVNTISGKKCNALRLQDNIKKTNVVLEIYKGFRMQPIGEVTALLDLDGKSLETKCVVIDKSYESKSILGLETLQSLN